MAFGSHTYVWSMVEPLPYPVWPSTSGNFTPSERRSNELLHSPKWVLHQALECRDEGVKSGGREGMYEHGSASPGEQHALAAGITARRATGLEMDRVRSFRAEPDHPPGFTNLSIGSFRLSGGMPLRSRQRSRRVFLDPPQLFGRHTIV